MALPAGETYTSQQMLESYDNTDLKRYEEKRVYMINDLFQMAEPVVQTQYARWQQGYEYYYNFERQYRLKQPHQSKIFVPRTFQVIESKTPQIAMSFLQQSPIFSITPVGTDDIEQAKICESLLSWQMRKIPNIMLSLTLWIKDAHLYGGSIIKTGWAYEEAMMPDRVKMPPQLDFAGAQVMQDQQIIQRPVVTQDNPTIINCDMGEMFPDPTASCIEDCKFIIQRIVKPIHEIKALGAAGYYKNVDQITQDGGVSHWVNDFTHRRYSTQNISDPFRLQNSIYEYVELLECWWVDPSDPLLRKWKTTIANRRVLLQDIPITDIYWHNRFPFKLLKNIPMTKEFWGISEADVIVMMQRELNSLRNQRMDNINALNKGFWIANRNAGINAEKLAKMGPGDIMWTNDVNGVRAERPPSVETVTQYSEMACDRDIQLTTGINDMVTGTPTRSQMRNATSATLLEQASKTRLGLTALLFTEQMKGIGEDFLALDYQYMSPETVIPILGADGLKYRGNVTPDMIPRNPDVCVTLGAEIQGNADVKKNMLLQLTDILMAVPGFNATDWCRDLAKDFGKKDIDKYFVGEDYVMQTEDVLKQLGITGGSPGQSNFKSMSSNINPLQSNQFSQDNVGEIGESTYAQGQ